MTLRMVSELRTTLESCSKFGGMDAALLQISAQCRQACPSRQDMIEGVRRINAGFDPPNRLNLVSSWVGGWKSVRR